MFGELKCLNVNAGRHCLKLQKIKRMKSSSWFWFLCKWSKHVNTKGCNSGASQRNSLDTSCTAQTTEHVKISSAESTVGRGTSRTIWINFWGNVSILSLFALNVICPILTQWPELDPVTGSPKPRRAAADWLGCQRGSAPLLRRVHATRIGLAVKGDSLLYWDVCTPQGQACSGK